MRMRKGLIFPVSVLVVLVATALGTLATNATVRASAERESSAGEWVLHTRRYVADRSDTWDAYLVNSRTGEVYFINQNTSTRVVEGKAKGAK